MNLGFPLKDLRGPENQRETGGWGEAVLLSFHLLQYRLLLLLLLGALMTRREKENASIFTEILRWIQSDGLKPMNLIGCYIRSHCVTFTCPGLNTYYCYEEVTITSSKLFYVQSTISQNSAGKKFLQGYLWELWQPKFCFSFFSAKLSPSSEISIGCLRSRGKKKITSS